MSKQCAKCSKSVYPIEELKCLDKVWHKSCFRCQECNMALNMKNYKGYNKLPYCNAHYPTTKFTAVAETPEMSRIAQNTKMQSQVKYHEDFEKNIKGSKIQVADDPETLRIRASHSVISSVEYKGLKDKASDMEQRRGSIPKDDEVKRQSSTVETVETEHYPAPQYHPEPAPPVQQPPSPAPPSAPSGLVYQAMYDYEAQDEDEVGFVEGDFIVECQPIDEGWMFGTIRRTGLRGMLPANYVELVQ